jgi:hypothetical protein
MDVAIVKDILGAFEKHSIFLLASTSSLLACGLLGTADIKLGPLTIPKRDSALAFGVVSLLAVALMGRLAYLVSVSFKALTSAPLLDSARGLANFSPWFLSPFCEFGTGTMGKIVSHSGPVLAGSLAAALVQAMDAHAKNDRKRALLYLAFVPVALLAAIAGIHAMAVVCQDTATSKAICMVVSFFVSLLLMGRYWWARLRKNLA